ncbi:MAG: type III-B CRISPR module-associated protein Cmr3 [candidate division WOR-3 bacterium]
MLKFTIKPFDVLFFGGGKPFNLGDTARSVFPAFPHTFASALCSKIYFEYKIDVSNILKSVYGPFLFNEEENKIYFLKPADIFTQRKKREGLFSLKIENDDNFSLFKYENTNKPDGYEKLPVYQGEKDIDSFEGLISQDGLQDWVNGKEVKEKEIKKFFDVFEYERRVGIKQSVETHTVVGEDGLYRVDFLRLKKNWSFVFYVEFNYESLINDLEDENKVLEFFRRGNRVLKLGGEMKVAYYDVELDDLRNVIKRPAINEGEIIKILFLTHSTFNKDSFLTECNGVKVISAVISSYSILAIMSKGLNLGKFTKRGIRAGNVVYGEVLNRDLVKDLWFGFFCPYKKGNKTFIGTNLVIYGKI